MRLPFTVIVITYAIAMTGFLFIPGIDDQGNEYHLSIFESFYFVTYTATTIGFGELPYPFTHAQKIWASMSIYVTVLGWFYGIGTLVSLLQDKLFLSEIALARFKRSVKNIKEDFVIILGYNETTSVIIEKLLASKMRVVVIERNQQRADYLHLEGFVPTIPVLVRDIHHTSSLEFAGITSIHCKGIISLLDDSILNLRVTLASKILNPHVRVAMSSTRPEETENLIDVGADIVDNPFEIIAKQIEMSLVAPSLFRLENWLYNIEALDSKTFTIPNEKIIICGYGRFGITLNKMFLQNGIKPTIIESDERMIQKALNDGIEKVIQGNAEDKHILEQADIENTNVIIIGTNNDTTNLSIVSTAKKMNKNTLIIARENELLDYSIFSHAKIDHIFLPSQILIHKTTNAIINPLCDIMIQLISNKNELWGKQLLSMLIKNIGINPITYEMSINKNDAFEIYKYLQNPNNSIKIELLRSSRRDRKQHNNIYPLLVVRDKENILLPDLDFELQINDKILFACDKNAQEDLEYIVNNIYEFHYMMTGEEKQYFTKFINFNKKGKQ